MNASFSSITSLFGYNVLNFQHLFGVLQRGLPHPISDDDLWGDGEEASGLEGEEADGLREGEERDRSDARAEADRLEGEEGEVDDRLGLELDSVDVSVFYFSVRL